jgi:hypothetical protein
MKTNYVALLWSQMADEARKAARSIQNQDVKLHVLLVAARYLVMAKRSETDERPAHQQEKPSN